MTSSPLDDLKMPLIGRVQASNDNRSTQSVVFKGKDLSSIHSHDNPNGFVHHDVHYLIDVPSPRFSSVVNGGDEEGEDDEKVEIIRCIVHNDAKTLREILA